MNNYKSSGDVFTMNCVDCKHYMQERCSLSFGNIEETEIGYKFVRGNPETCGSYTKLELDDVRCNNCHFYHNGCCKRIIPYGMDINSDFSWKKMDENDFCVDGLFITK